MISDFRFYFKLLSRRLPWMVMLFLLVACAGVVIAFRLPTLFQTQATLLVESAQISDDLVRSSVQVTAVEQLEVIQQRLMTRANLIDIANEVRVFPNASDMSPDEVVSAMRAATNIRRSSGRNRATLMTISFEGSNPRQVAQVVNRYVDIVLEISGSIRTGAAESTLAFFEQEVEGLSQDLDIQNTKILAFKAENKDALPDDMEYRLGQQDRLQQRLLSAERDLESLKSQRESILAVYEETGRIGQSATVQLTPEQAQLKQLESQLQVALTTYSENNIRVKNLRAQIGVLAEQVAADTATVAQPVSADPQTAALNITITEIDARIANLEQEIMDATATLAVLRSSIERTPANGIALEAMERELANIQALYSAAVNRLSQARLSESVELSGRGERITVLEAANVPDSPSSPNRPAVMALGVGAGLGLAAGLFMLLELLNQSIRRPVDIVRALEITPLATVPRIESLARRRIRRMNQILVLLIVVAGVPAALWALDTYYLPLDLLFEKLKDRLL